MTDDIFTALAARTLCLRNLHRRPRARDAAPLGRRHRRPGDRHFQVIHTPGHSPGGIALWEAATGILFSGDIVYDGELIEGTSDLERWQYRASMERLLALPVRVVHGGHFPSYSGDRHRALIRDWLAAKDREG